MRNRQYKDMFTSIIEIIDVNDLDFRDTYIWSILLKIFQSHEPGRSRLTHDHLFNPVRVFATALRTKVLTEPFAKGVPIILYYAWFLVSFVA